MKIFRIFIVVSKGIGQIKKKVHRQLTADAPGASAQRTGTPSFRQDSVLLDEVIFADAAEGANPIRRDVFPGSAGSDSAVRITDFGIIDVTASCAFILVHGFSP